MIFADYTFYSTEYLGGAIGEEDFHRLALRASKWLDYYTQGRAEKNADLYNLKMACCAVAEQYMVIDAAQEAASNGFSSDNGVTQEKVGDWSRSYRSGADSVTSALSAVSEAKIQLAKIADMYLATTGLLYRGGCR